MDLRLQFWIDVKICYLLNNWRCVNMFLSKEIFSVDRSFLYLSDPMIVSLSFSHSLLWLANTLFFTKLILQNAKHLSKKSFVYYSNLDVRKEKDCAFAFFSSLQFVHSMVHDIYLITCVLFICPCIYYDFFVSLSFHFSTHSHSHISVTSLIDTLI